MSFDSFEDLEKEVKRLKQLQCCEPTDVAVQYMDEGIALGTPGTVNEIDFTGDLTAARVGNKVTVSFTAAATTLAGVSAASLTAPNSLYTMSAGIPVEFRSSDANPILYIDETNERVGIGTAPAFKFDVTGSIAGALIAGITNTDAGGFGLRIKAGTTSSTYILNLESSAGTSAFRFYPSGFGAGTVTPDRLIHAEVSDAVTNAVTYAQRLTHITSGTAAASFGIGVEYELENASGTNRIAGTQEFTWSDATDATEDATYRLKLMNSGVSTQTVLTVESNGALTALGSITGSNLIAGAGANIFWTGRSVLSSPSNGVITIWNNATTDFNRLQFGGTTSAFPSLKRSGTGIIVRLADDSLDTSFQAKYFLGNVGDALTATGTVIGDALQLSNQINNVTTTASGTGVILPTGVVGMRITVFNAGANVLKVYANGSEAIDGTAGSTGVSLTNGRKADYFYTSANVWNSALLGNISS